MTTNNQHEVTDPKTGRVWTTREIAAEAGISQSTVRNRIKSKWPFDKIMQPRQGNGGAVLGKTPEAVQRPERPSFDTPFRHGRWV